MRARVLCWLSTCLCVFVLVCVSLSVSVFVVGQSLLSPNLDPSASDVTTAITSTVNDFGLKALASGSLPGKAEIVGTILSAIFFGGSPSQPAPPVVTIQQIQDVITNAVGQLSSYIADQNRQKTYTDIYNAMTTATTVMSNCNNYLLPCTQQSGPNAIPCIPDSQVPTLYLNSAFKTNCLDQLSSYITIQGNLAQQLLNLRQDQTNNPTSTRPLATLVQGIGIMHTCASTLIKLRAMLVPDYTSDTPTTYSANSDLLTLMNLYATKFLPMYIDMRNFLVKVRLQSSGEGQFTFPLGSSYYTYWQLLDTAAPAPKPSEMLVPHPVLRWADVPGIGSSCPQCTVDEAVTLFQSGNVYCSNNQNTDQCMIHQSGPASAFVPTPGTSEVSVQPYKTFAKAYQQELKQRIERQVQIWDAAMCNNAAATQAATLIGRPCWFGSAPTLTQVLPGSRSYQPIASPTLPVDIGVSTTQNRKVVYAVWVVGGKLNLVASRIPSNGVSFSWTTLYVGDTGTTTKAVGVPAVFRVSDVELGVYYNDDTGHLRFCRIILNPPPNNANSDITPQTVLAVVFNTMPVFRSTNSVYQGITVQDTIRAVVHRGMLYLSFLPGGFICVARLDLGSYWIYDSNVTCTNQAGRSASQASMTPTIAVHHERIYLAYLFGLHSYVEPLIDTFGTAVPVEPFGKLLPVSPAFPKTPIYVYGTNWLFSAEANNEITDGSTVNLQQVYNLASEGLSQYWSFDGSLIYTPSTTYGRVCLDSAHTNPGHPANLLIVRPCNANNIDQQWKTRGDYRIENIGNPGWCLDSTGFIQTPFMQVRITLCDTNNKGQLFSSYPQAPPLTDTPLALPIVTSSTRSPIYVYGTNFLLNAWGGIQAIDYFSPIKTYLEDPPASNEVFEFDKSTGSISVPSAIRGKLCLGIPTIATPEAVALFSCDSTLLNQQWIWRADYLIESKYLPGSCMDTISSNLASNLQPQMAPCDANSATQKFATQPFFIDKAANFGTPFDTPLLYEFDGTLQVMYIDYYGDGKWHWLNCTNCIDNKNDITRALTWKNVGADAPQQQDAMVPQKQGGLGFNSLHVDESSGQLLLSAVNNADNRPYIYISKTNAALSTAQSSSVVLVDEPGVPDPNTAPLPPAPEGTVYVPNLLTDALAPPSSSGAAGGTSWPWSRVLLVVLPITVGLVLLAAAATCLYKKTSLKQTITRIQSNNHPENTQGEVELGPTTTDSSILPSTTISISTTLSVPAAAATADSSGSMSISNANPISMDVQVDTDTPVLVTEP